MVVIEMIVMFVRKTRKGTLVFSSSSLNLPFLRWATIALVGCLFSPCPNLNKKTKDMNYTTPFNLKKLHKEEFNLKFDETIAIGFITQSIF